MQDLTEFAEKYVQRGHSLPDVGDDQDKWVVRSGLQKACRRGQTELALERAARLSQIDTAYAFHSMAIIAVEDIGLLNPGLINLTLCTIAKTVRRGLSVSEDELLAGMVVSACETPIKSRAFCELDLGASRDPLGKPDFGSMHDDELKASLISDDLSHAFLASVELRRRYSIGDDNMESLVSWMGSNLPLHQEDMDDTWLMCALSFERRVDTMHNAVWPVVRGLIESGEEIVGEQDSIPEFGEIAPGVRPEALDMHNQTGKKAIRAFYTSLKNTKAYPFLSELDDKAVIPALGSLIFVEEGGLVDWRATSPMLSSLKDYQDHSFCVSSGVPEELLGDFRSMVRNEMDRLSAKRKWAYHL